MASISANISPEKLAKTYHHFSAAKLGAQTKFAVTCVHLSVGRSQNGFVILVPFEHNQKFGERNKNKRKIP